ncbi:hypothetical protein [Desulfuromonas sp.]|nr:hypothetical protein [Desulfuromonas sp.]
MIRLIFSEAGERSQMPISHREVKPQRARVSSSSSGIWSRRVMVRP